MTPAQEAQLGRYADLLREAPLNLLSRRDRELVWERHVGESLRVCERLPLGAEEEWLDLGTGGGLPGLVLAILRPDLRVVLLDAREKKITAVRGFIEALSLDNAQAVSGRAEWLARDPSWRRRFDGVITRAVGRLTTVVELSRGFVAPQGLIVAVRGGRVDEELGSLRGTMDRLAVQELHISPIPEAVRQTRLVTMRAQGDPPEEFPRPDGVPAARPLG